MITIALNGKKREIFSSKCTLCSFIENESIERSLVLIKMNGKVVLYKDHKNRYLNDGDIIDVEHVLIAGG